MMNSYHYCYYYCYGYDDYPSYCCRSILLNDFLSLDERDLFICAPWQHLCSSLVVPEKDYSNGKHPPLYYLHPAINLQTSPTCYGRPLWFLWPWISPIWLSNLNMMFVQTYFTVHDDVFCSSAVYGLCTLSVCSLLVYFSLTSSPQSVIVCSPNRILVFNILTDVVNTSYSDSAASVVSMVPSSPVLVIWM